ncbi:MAG TPA: hypothetical protein PKD12_08200 [Nitrospira sp.]|nr:hypothetical protein [Nitrospira sp.]
MLNITVGGTESFDESTQAFVTSDGFDLRLEHSLVSLSKWESIYEKPFLGEAEKTVEELVGYVKAMTLTPEVPEEVFSTLNESNFEAINAYINAKMTATWFNEAPGAPKAKEVITAELIYYWLTVFNIPFEVETWHLNRLFTLIRICNVKSAKPQKMSRADAMRRNKELNEQRRQQHQTKG